MRDDPVRRCALDAREAALEERAQGYLDRMSEIAYHVGESYAERLIRDLLVRLIAQQQQIKELTETLARVGITK